MHKCKMQVSELSIKYEVLYSVPAGRSPNSQIIQIEVVGDKMVMPPRQFG